MSVFNIVKQVAKRVLPQPLADALRRVAYPIRNAGLFIPYVIHKEMEGESFDFVIGDRTGRDWYDRPCINNPRWLEMRFVKERLVTPGDVIFECGGHHGCSGILLSRWVGASGRVVTFEPDAANFAILRQNIALNGLTNVEAHRAAVGATAGSLTFEPSANGVDPTGRGHRVPMVRLDDYADAHPTFLKIDVEGFEIEVVRGARHVLAARPKLAIEVHADFLAKYGHAVEELFELLPVAEYRWWIQWRDDLTPEPYDPENPATPITHRAHLFGLPR
jgi:FkbM family methyltransferase